MSGFTAKYQLPTLLSADPVSQAPTIEAALANRADLLLGEGGQYPITVGAVTTHAQVITLARTYPGSNVGAVPGTVILQLNAGPSAGLTWFWWVTSWTGSASTITGFTIGTQWSAAQAARTMTWRFLPYL